MANQKKSMQLEKQEITAKDRLGLRISSMINHPTAQTQRWAVIHKLDTDGRAEWEELLGELSETAGLDMTYEEDGTVLLEWEAPSDEDRPVRLEELEPIELVAPF